MQLPLNERFTSVQKDDLAAAIRREVDGMAPDARWDKLATRIFEAVRGALEAEGLDLDLSDQQINDIANDVSSEVGDGFDTDNYATDQVVQAVEDFLCI